MSFSRVASTAACSRVRRRANPVALRFVELGRLHKRSGAKGIHPGFEVCLARGGGLAFGGGVLGQPRDVGDGRLMLTPSLIAGLFHLAQLRGEATAFRLGLSPLALEVRLTFGELAGRHRQRIVVPLLLIPQGGSVLVTVRSRVSRVARSSVSLPSSSASRSVSRAMSATAD